MCEPTSIAIVAGGVSAVSTMKQGEAIETESTAQANLALNNRRKALKMADDARERGGNEERRYRQTVAGVKSSQRAGFAKSGVEVDTASAFDVTTQTEVLGEIDALTIRLNAERAALGFKTQAEEFGLEAKGIKKRGESARKASNIQAFTTLLGTAKQFQ